MSTLGDIVGILEKIPVWKRLNGLPDEVDALKARISALEAALSKKPSGEACPLCNQGVLRVVSVTPDPTFGELGLQQRKMTCDNASCGHTENRQHDPNKSAR